jgi:chorismate mutase/prephenate dehydratase
MPGTKNEYQFFVECEGHTADVKVKRALTSLEKKTVRLDVLGSYPRTEPEDA